MREICTCSCVLLLLLLGCVLLPAAQAEQAVAVSVDGGNADAKPSQLPAVTSPNLATKAIKISSSPSPPLTGAEPNRALVTSTTAAAPTTSTTTLPPSTTQDLRASLRSAYLFVFHYAIFAEDDFGAPCSSAFNVSYKLRFLDRPTENITVDMTHTLDLHPMYRTDDGLCVLMFKPLKRTEAELYARKVVDVSQSSRLQLDLSVQAVNNTAIVSFIKTIYAWSHVHWGEMSTSAIGQPSSLLVWSHFAVHANNINCTPVMRHSSFYEYWSSQSAAASCPAWVESSAWFIALLALCLLQTALLAGAFFTWQCFDWDTYYRQQRNQRRKRRRERRQLILEQTYNAVAVEQGMDDANGTPAEPAQPHPNSLNSPL